MHATSTRTIRTPARLRELVPYRVGFALRAATLAADPTTLRRLLRLRHEAPGQLVALRLRPLGGAEVHVRSGTSDLWVATETLAPAFHLPGPEVDRDAARLVWDLGANVGITTAHLAIRMPRAEVVAVELDAANAGLARRNLSAHGGRCRVVEAGVWTHDGRLRYGGDAGQEVGFRVGGGDRSAEALSLDTLLARGGGGPVDYVKMDLEGAEREVLRHATGWAAHVRAIRVEVHEPYTVAECQDDLRALGFAVSVPALPDGYDGMQPVVGVRG